MLYCVANDIGNRAFERPQIAFGMRTDDKRRADDNDLQPRFAPNPCKAHFGLMLRNGVGRMRRGFIIVAISPTPCFSAVDAD